MSLLTFNYKTGHRVAGITLAALLVLLVVALQLYQLNMVRQGNILVVPSPSPGDMVYYDGSEWVKLSSGKPGQVLETGGVGGVLPRWKTTLPLSPDSGDLLYYDGSEWVKLSPGEPGQVLETGGAGSAPRWTTTLPLNPGSGDLLYYDGSEWVSAPVGQIPGTVDNASATWANVTPRTATVVVAASDASADSKAQADYVCDGTADDKEIQAAIDALPGPGGLIYLTEGTFYLSDEIYIARGGVGIKGALGFSQYSPLGTRLIGARDRNVLHYNPPERISPFLLSNVTISHSGGTSGNGIYAQKNVNSFIIENVFIWDVPEAAIRIEDDGSGDDWTFANIHLRNVEVELSGGQYGLYARVSRPTQNLWGLRISQSHFVGGSVGAVYLEGASNFQMIGGVIENVDGYGLRMKDVSNSHVAFVQFYNWDADNDSADDAILIDDATYSVVILGNSFRPGSAQSRNAIRFEGGGSDVLISNNVCRLPEGDGSMVAPLFVADWDITTVVNNVGFEPSLPK